jgi:hypothetical protein
MAALTPTARIAIYHHEALNIAQTPNLRNNLPALYMLSGTLLLLKEEHEQVGPEFKVRLYRLYVDLVDQRIQELRPRL